MKKVVGGGILIFIGFFMLLGFAVSTKDSSLMVDLMSVLLFVLAPVVAGILLVRSHYRSNRKVQEEQKKVMLAAREKEVIQLAKRHKGSLTIPEIVAETSMTTAEADEVMKELVVNRYVDMKMLDNGVIVYEFFEIQQSYAAEPERKDRLDSLIE